MKKTTAILALAGLLSGCVHHERVHTVVLDKPTGAILASNTLDTVRYPATYKVCYLGRRIDPHNPDLMYEAARIYLREAPETWNLHPHPPARLPAGPEVGPTNAAYSPLPVEPELRAELNAQRKATQAMLDQGKRLAESTGQLNSVAKKILEQQQGIHQRLQATDARLRLLEETVRRTPANPNQEGSSAGQTNTQSRD